MAHTVCCTLCATPILGYPRSPDWNVCLLCVLSAEEARQALDDAFVLEPHHPGEPDGGHFFFTRRENVSPSQPAPAFEAPAVCAASFRRLDDLKTRWF